MARATTCISPMRSIGSCRTPCPAPTVCSRTSSRCRRPRRWDKTNPYAERRVLTDRVYMLHADHLWQWEEWCDAHGVARQRIAEVKEMARRAFDLARQRSSKVRQHGALLVDSQYGSDSVARALASGVEVGTPAEKAGAFPLQWAAERLSDVLTGRFVKVLVRHRDDQPQAMRQAQREKLLRLQEWCTEVGKALVVEVLVPRHREAEDVFEAEGRPAMLA